MAEHIQARVRALALFAAPLTTLIALIYHPNLKNELDLSAAAAAVLADPYRWVIAHFMLMLAFGLILLAIVALRALLRSAGEERWSFIAVQLLVLGSTIFIGVWGFEITVAAVANVGGDVEAVFREADQWFGPVGVVGYLMYIVGWISMAWAVRRSHVLEPRWTRVVMAATILMVIGVSIPATLAGYVFAVGMMGFAWPMAYQALSGTDRVSAQ